MINKNIFLLSLVFLFFSFKSYSFETKAETAFLLDTLSDTVLFEKKGDVPYGPASMSKMMLTYLVFEKLQNGSLNLQEEFLVSKKAWKFGGSKMFVKVGDRVSVNDLLKGVIIQSGNDACIVLAEGISGSEENMVNEMNNKANEIGLTNTKFQNVTGWPDKNHYMSARDIAYLSKDLIEKFPEYYHLFSIREFTYNEIKQLNRNRLLNYDGYDGLKTGRTTQTGYGLAGSYTKGNRRIISVVNGLNSDNERIKATTRLTNWAFRNFETYQIFSENQVVSKSKVWLGKKPFISLLSQEDINITVSKENLDKLKITAVYESPISAPIKTGDKLGKIIIYNGENEIIKDLIAKEDIGIANRFSRSFSIINYLIFGISSPEKK